jgi:hypothetical protein
LVRARRLATPAPTLASDSVPEPDADASYSEG